jgi:hypothetical protein
MGKKEKQLCDWSKKDLSKNFDDFKKIVKAPQFACKKCARVASEKKWLCKPIPLFEN